MRRWWVLAATIDSENLRHFSGPAPLPSNFSSPSLPHPGPGVSQMGRGDAKAAKVFKSASTKSDAVRFPFLTVARNASRATTAEQIRVKTLFIFVSNFRSLRAPPHPQPPCGPAGGRRRCTLSTAFSGENAISKG